MAKTKVTFERSMQQLDDIVNKLSSGDTALEDMIRLYERGIEISKKCRVMLDDFESRLDIAVKGETTKDDEQQV